MLPPVPDSVRYEAADGIATLTLDRPDRLNTIDPALARDLEACLDRAEEDADVRVIRLRGEGRVFCAGYDIGWGAEVMEESEAGRPWTRWPT